MKPENAHGYRYQDYSKLHCEKTNEAKMMDPGIEASVLAHAQ